MPIQYELYPDNWFTEIRPVVLERATKNGVVCCEWCSAENDRWIWYHPSASDYPEMAHIWTQDEVQAAKWYGYISDHEAPKDGYMVTLTIAHVHDSDPMNCELKNLAALCQTCHLRHDAKLHAMNKIRNKNAKLEALGQLRLF